MVTVAIGMVPLIEVLKMHVGSMKTQFITLAKAFYAVTPYHKPHQVSKMNSL